MQALARAAWGLWPAARTAVVEGGYHGQALTVMERKMRSSGMERLIRRRIDHHVKNSEKRVLARKALLQRVRSQELGKKLREILIKKISKQERAGKS